MNMSIVYMNDVHLRPADCCGSIQTVNPVVFLILGATCPLPEYLAYGKEVRIMCL